MRPNYTTKVINGELVKVPRRPSSKQGRKKMPKNEKRKMCSLRFHPRTFPVIHKLQVARKEEKQARMIENILLEEAERQGIEIH